MYQGVKSYKSAIPSKLVTLTYKIGRPAEIPKAKNKNIGKYKF